MIMELALIVFYTDVHFKKKVSMLHMGVPELKSLNY